MLPSLTHHDTGSAAAGSIPLDSVGAVRAGLGALGDALGDRDGPAGGPIHGFYIHIPFCFHKCHYCDFYSIVDREDRQAAFTARLRGEIAALTDEVARQTGRRPAPTTVFVGGGTPTLLRADLWSDLLRSLANAIDTSALVEFTVEANPETVTADLIGALAAGGVNRVSVGCQSFHPTHLKALERWHDPANVLRSMGIARSAGIENLNLDLIYAIPGQTFAEWLDDLRRAIDLGPMHLSCYALTYEPNTPMTAKLRSGRITAADSGLEAEMFTATIETLAAAGYGQYEVSNFARAGRRCGHNLNYWHGGNWLAAGPGAAGHVNGVRYKNRRHLGVYLASYGGVPLEEYEQLDERRRLGEQLMLRLRLNEGVELAWLEPRLDGERRGVIEVHLAAGLLERTATHLRLTPAGLLLGDSVIADLL